MSMKSMSHDDESMFIHLSKVHVMSQSHKKFINTKDDASLESVAWHAHKNRRWINFQQSIYFSLTELKKK